MGRYVANPSHKRSYSKEVNPRVYLPKRKHVSDTVRVLVPEIVTANQNFTIYVTGGYTSPTSKPKYSLVNLKDIALTSFDSDTGVGVVSLTASEGNFTIYVRDVNNYHSEKGIDFTLSVTGA